MHFWLIPTLNKVQLLDIFVASLKKTVSQLTTTPELLKKDLKIPSIQPSVCVCLHGVCLCV